MVSQEWNLNFYKKCLTIDPRLKPPSAKDFIYYLKESIELGAKLNVNVIAYPYMGIDSAPLQFCDGNLQNRIVVGATGDVTGCLEVQSSDHDLFKYFELGQYDTFSNEIKLKDDSSKMPCSKFDDSNLCNFIEEVASGLQWMSNEVFLWNGLS